MNAPQPGERIRLVRMDDDPDPIPVGTEGRVTSIHEHAPGFTQVHVDWDNGRTLMLSMPKDVVTVIHRTNSKGSD